MVTAFALRRRVRLSISRAALPPTPRAARGRRAHLHDRRHHAYVSCPFLPRRLLYLIFVVARGAIALGSALIGGYVALLVAQTIRYAYLRLRYKRLPPGRYIGVLPIIGETAEFGESHNRNPMTFWYDHLAKYGPIFYCHLFFTPAVVVSGDFARKLVAREGNGVEHRFPSWLKHVTGHEGMGMHGEPVHMQQRTIIMRALGSAVLGSAGAFVDMIGRRLADASNRSVHFQDVAHSIAMDVALHVSLGDVARHLDRAEVERIVLLQQEAMVMPTVEPLPYVPGTLHYRSRQARARFQEAVTPHLKRLVEEARARGPDSPGTWRSVAECFAAELAANGEGPKGLTWQSFVDNSLGIIHGATHTTVGHLCLCGEWAVGVGVGRGV